MLMRIIQVWNKVCIETYHYRGTKIYVKFVSHPTGPIMIFVSKLDLLENKKNKANQKLMKILEQSLKNSSAYSLFVYAIRS
jgi:hypothetical protein